MSLAPYGTGDKSDESEDKKKIIKKHLCMLVFIENLKLNPSTLSTSPFFCPHFVVFIYTA